ncbi:MAG: UDP-N-acetylmuramoyl-tripeptide--D-alanyl-D-alanine ligase [Endomicrobium sp.]|jgi:UDP-N-acetylmuramoyl-tripeptide--D-alanyl-D-alanine ligase|nr:UDP-N-acetylmuramoyl-tripeptide--D-alanyl-D-alanine ligase [Endomicrobium sp.]
MESFYLKDLIKAVDGKFLIGDPNLPIKSVSVDSRTVRKGQFFFALKGKYYDGHKFIKDVVEKEAAGIVYSQDDADFAKPFPKFPSIVKVGDTLTALGELAKAYRRRFTKTKIVGITGSNGKTTTKEILKLIFSKKDKTVSNKGNFNNRIGLPLSVFELKSDVKYAVFEMGTSERGEIKTLADILQPSVGIITNIGSAHLETFQNTEGVFAEKRALLDAVPEDGFVVINNDDPTLKKIQQKSYSKVISFALYGGADVFAKNITIWEQEVSFELHYGSSFVNISMPVRGKFNVLNALAAAACASGFGFDLETIKDGVETFTPPAMRMETLTTKGSVTLINDAYNANPSSVKASIQAVCEAYGGGEINLVLGDMLELGEKSQEYHFEIGEYINDKKINSVYLLGDTSLYIKEALNKKNVFHAYNAQDLLERLYVAPASKKSVFLFKGSRAMKLEEVYSKYYNFLDKGKK